MRIHLFADCPNLTKRTPLDRNLRGVQFSVRRQPPRDHPAMVFLVMTRLNCLYSVFGHGIQPLDEREIQMKAFILLLVGVCTFAAYPDTQGAGTNDGQPGGTEATQAVNQESPAGPEEKCSDQAMQTAESPWQGVWRGSELDSFGTRISVRATIRVTNGKISGNWNARGRGLQPITGQVNGKEAAITILQGGSNIKATLIDKNTLEYSGLRGHGTLSRQQEGQERGLGSE